MSARMAPVSPVPSGRRQSGALARRRRDRAAPEDVRVSLVPGSPSSAARDQAESSWRTCGHDVSVSDDLLRSYVRELRVALGDDARTPRYIATIARRGYKFLPEVIAGPSEEHRPSSDRPRPRRSTAVRLTPRSTRPPIRVGVLHSLTGMMAASETSVVDATLLAIEELNQQRRRARPTRRVVRGRRSVGRARLRARGRATDHRRPASAPSSAAGRRRAARPCETSSNATIVSSFIRCSSREWRSRRTSSTRARLRTSRSFLRSAGRSASCASGATSWSARDTVFSWAANAMIRDEVRMLGGEIVGEAYLSPNGANVAHVVQAIAQIEPDLILNTVGGELSIAVLAGAARVGHHTGPDPDLVLQRERARASRPLAVGQRRVTTAPGTTFRASNARRTRHSSIDSGRATARGASCPIRWRRAYVGVHLWARRRSRRPTTTARAAVRQSLRSQSFDAPEGLVRIDPESQYAWKTMRARQGGRGRPVRGHVELRAAAPSRALRELALARVVDASCSRTCSGAGTGTGRGGSTEQLVTKDRI